VCKLACWPKRFHTSDKGPPLGASLATETEGEAFRSNRDGPITNRPQVTNLPHIASATCLLWCRIVAARGEMDGLEYECFRVNA
jgi:hypothetical protein